MTAAERVAAAGRRAADDFDAAEHRYRERRRTQARIAGLATDPYADAPLPRLLAPAVRRSD